MGMRMAEDTWPMMAISFTSWTPSTVSHRAKMSHRVSTTISDTWRLLPVSLPLSATMIFRAVYSPSLLTFVSSTALPEVMMPCNSRGE